MVGKRRGYTLAVLVAVVAGGAALAGGMYLRETLDTTGPEVVVLRHAASESVDLGRRPEFRLAGNDGKVHSISEWDGKLLLVNFWATWCPPCLHEIPIFIELQARYAARGVQFLGIAIDERDNVLEFAAEVGLNYPTLFGQLDAIDIGKAFGNRTGGLPYTVLVAPDGTIIARHIGAMSRSQAEALIESNL